MPRNHSYSRSPKRSRSRSPKRSRSRNRDRSSDRDRNSRRNRSQDRGGRRDDRGGRDYGRDNSRDQSEERRLDDLDKCRIHVADLSDSITQYDIEKHFNKFGEISEVWMAKNPPCFAFCVFKNKSDAAEAVREMDNKVIGNNRCRVTFARPRTRGRKRHFDPDMKCFQCGGRGHFSRNCDGGNRRGYGGGNRHNDRSRSRGRNNYSRRSRSRNSRGRSRS
jgi:arginine/serine-rich splicing factor 7